jgi:tetratricopeptide (TPR) repeat protein
MSMFTYPFRAGVLSWIVGLSLAMIVVQGFTGALEVHWVPRFEVSPESSAIAFGVLGILMEVYWWMMAFKLAVEAMRRAAAPESERGRDIWVEDEQAARQVLLWGGALLVGYLLYANLGGHALAAYCVLLAALMPAIVVLLGMEHSLRLAFDPSQWRALLRHSGSGYWVVTAKLVMLALLFLFVQMQFFAQQPRGLGVPLGRLLLLYLLVASFHELGRMLDRPRRERRAAEQGEIARPEVVVTEEEELSMRAANRYEAEGRYAKAAEQLMSLVCTPVASPAAHARFRELLGRADDRPRLLVHARLYLAAFLAWGQESEALALYRDSLEMDPAFEVREHAVLHQLIAIALRDQHPQLAISLAQEYLRRFPNEPDAVGNGLAAARMLDRLGLDEEARVMLADLVRRFPGHPLRSEVVAALETLEGVARRAR